ncbi:MAG: hypothetical protein AMS27_16320 [Bacteroides sp. SM23_62_1]|nr:MAG: hypothetical protein AMS27_16320 [Bacteroides sp. SM23_62_1]
MCFVTPEFALKTSNLLFHCFQLKNAYIRTIMQLSEASIDKNLHFRRRKSGEGNDPQNTPFWPFLIS